MKVNKQKIKNISSEVFWGSLALLAGTVIIYFGDRFLNVSLEVVQQNVISTFHPLWVLDLILVPLIAGFAVSLIYGLGGKILAHFAPIFIRLHAFIMIDASALPEGVSVLPTGFWILILIVCVEAAAAGGLVGEIVIKRTYGRRPKHMIHKRYQTKNAE